MHENKCKKCSKEFRTYKKNQKFCSLNCSSKSQKKNNFKKLICSNCKISFTFQASPSKVNRRKYCSNECRWNAKKTKFKWSDFKCSSKDCYLQIKEIGNYDTDSLGKRALQISNKNNFDHDFLSKGIIDEYTAYFLGIMLSDGSVAKRINKRNGSISFVSSLELIDKQIIQDLAKILKYKNKISVRKVYNNKKQHTSNSYKISLGSFKIFQDLNKMGCTPSKTYNVKYPIIKNELNRHLIRGIIDGDGSFYIKDNQFLLSIVGTDTICRGIAETIRKHLDLDPQSCIYPSKYDSRSRMENFCHIKWNQSDTLKIYNWIYKDAKIYLKRKKEKINEKPIVYTDQISTTQMAKLCGVSVDYIKKHHLKAGAGNKNGRYRTYSENDILIWKNYIKNNKKRHLNSK